MDPVDQIDEHIQTMHTCIQKEYEEQFTRNNELLNNYNIDELELGGYAIKGFLINRQESKAYSKIYKLTLPETNERINLVDNQLIKAGFVGITIDEKTKPSIDAVIINIEPSSLTIFCTNNLLKIECKHFNIVTTVNDVTFNRMKMALNQYKMSIPKNYLLGLFAGINPLLPQFNSLQPYMEGLSFFQTRKIIWFNKNLNNSQKEAIKFALYQQDLAIINGPPGTGKTTTLVELILQLITRGYRILVSAPSNVAVDNIFKSLIQSYRSMANSYSLSYKKFKFVRIGNPIRIDKEIRPYAVEPKYNPNQRISTRRMKKIIERRLSEANVIMGTLTSSSVFHGQLKCVCPNMNELNNFQFDIVIIDECAQAQEPLALIPLISAKKCILAGDHKQLPPSVFSLEAEKLKISLFERLINKFGDEVSRMLTVQYRMNKIIMDWPSRYFYNSILTAHPSVASRYLYYLNKPLPAIRFINTAGCEMFELNNLTGIFEKSKANIYEANIACSIVLELLQMKVKIKDIGIIAPYRLQGVLIQRIMKTELRRANDLEINTVDAFQGREKEVILFSMVRSNKSGKIGFLSEERRFNVAITRAKKMLILIGDASTVSTSPALKDFLLYCLLNASIENAGQMNYNARPVNLDDIIPNNRNRRRQRRRRRR